MKKLLSLFALLALGVCVPTTVRAQSTNYPTTTTPESGDNEVLTLKKQLRIFNDAKAGTSPLHTTATPSGTTTVAGTVAVSSVAGTVTVAQSGAAQLTPAFSSNTASGNTTAGKSVLIFILSSDFTGTIGGVTFAGTTDSTLQLTAPTGSTFAAVAWTRSAGTIRVIQF